jgi:hypothetical protein
MLFNALIASCMQYAGKAGRVVACTFNALERSSILSALHEQVLQG